MNFPSESMSGANSSEPGCHVLGGTETPVDRTTARTSSRSRTACPGGTQWTPPRAVHERLECTVAHDEAAEGSLVLEPNPRRGAMVKMAVVSPQGQDTCGVPERRPGRVHDHVEQGLLVIDGRERAGEAENPAQLGGGAIEAFARRRGHGYGASRHLG